MSSSQPAATQRPSAEVGTGPAQAEETARTPKKEIIDLPLGKELNEAAATAFARQKQSRLIVLAGPVKGGKTTLLTSLYELFQWGPVADQNFSWSATLPGFEHRCHLARTASGSPAAETQRTIYTGPDPYYLHIQTASIPSSGLKTDFLFTDVSGEMFDHAVNSEAECSLLTFVKRASHLVLLVDGAKVVREDRNAAAQKSKSILRSLLDCRMISHFCYVTVVWAKCDYFARLSARDQKVLARFRKGVEDDFRSSFVGRIPDGKLQFKEIAARPKQKPEMGFGTGVVDLFGFWLAHAPHIRSLRLEMTTPSLGRESELFANRHFSAVRV